MEDGSLRSLSQPGTVICFAGSRHGTVPQAEVLVSAFARQNVSFLVGCAPGIDRCFRMVLAESSAASRSTVHCAFPSRLQVIRQEGLLGVCLVAGSPSAAAALHRRTVTMVSACSFLVLFPDNPSAGSWGRGSRLAFDTAVQQQIPEFAVTAIPPLDSRTCVVQKGALFGIVSGYRVVSTKAD